MQDSTQVPGVTDALDESAGKTETAAKPALPKGDKVRVMLRARFGAEVYDCWFHALEFESFDGRTVRASVPVKFLQTWIQAHYADGLLECCTAEFHGAERLEVVTREFGAGNGRIMLRHILPNAFAPMIVVLTIALGSFIALEATLSFLGVGPRNTISWGADIAEAQRWIREASRLHPDSWCIWRQGAGVNELGLAAQPDFWQRVDGLGAKRYYAPVDMPGMP